MCLRCSQYRRRERICQRATHRLPSTSFVTLGSLADERERERGRVREREGESEGREETRGSLHHWREAERHQRRRSSGRWDETDDTYWMTAGADDADWTQSPFQTLGKEDKTLTEELLSEKSLSEEALTEEQRVMTLRNIFHAKHTRF